VDAAGESVLVCIQIGRRGERGGETDERKKEREKEQRKRCTQQKFKDYLAVKMFKHF